VLRTTYRQRATRGAWGRLVLSGRLGGVVNVVLGSVMVLIIALPYLAGRTGLVELSDRSVTAEAASPPDWQWLAGWLDKREKQAPSETRSIFAGVGSAGARGQAGADRMAHPLGTDSAGRDILHMILIGAENAFLPGLYSVVLSISLGCLFGILLGYYGGWRGSIVSAIIKVVHSIPRLFLLLVVGAASNFDIYWIMTALGIVSFPKISETIAGKILSLQRQEFITAAREVGMKDRTILLKHILWYNCRHILFIQATFGMADAVLTETTLSYLGFGAQGVSWGRMVATGKDNLFNGMLWMSVLPALAIVLVILGFCLIGDGLSRIFKLKVT
jgi:peptide/nickel transport system permease protein